MEKNKQQTAVEWLWEIAYNRELTFEDWKQAKEMEKDIIINSHIEGQPLYSCQREKAEQYYEQTYGEGEQ
jgi:hypothetical protein